MRRHQGRDGWGRDSYNIPTYAVAGSSDCGNFSDSPAPTDKVLEELNRLIEHLEKEGVKASIGDPTASGNILMGKQWVVVSRGQFKRAKVLAEEWLDSHKRDTYYIHDAT